MTSTAAYLVETVIVLFAVIALSIVLLWTGKRVGLGRPRGPCQLIGRLPLDTRRCLYLVQIRDRVLVLGASDMGLTKLWQYRHTDRHTAHDPYASVPSSGSVSFAQVLAKLRQASRSARDTSKPTTDDPIHDDARESEQ